MCLWWNYKISSSLVGRQAKITCMCRKIAQLVRSPTRLSRGEVDRIKEVDSRGIWRCKIWVRGSFAHICFRLQWVPKSVTRTLYPYSFLTQNFTLPKRQRNTYLFRKIRSIALRYHEAHCIRSSFDVMCLPLLKNVTFVIIMWWCNASVASRLPAALSAIRRALLALLLLFFVSLISYLLLGLGDAILLQEVTCKLACRTTHLVVEK